jgi:transposase-like protein
MVAQKVQLPLGMKNSKSEVREESASRSKSRYFAPEVRQAIVAEIDAGMSKAEAARKYQVSQTTVFGWMQRYSPHYKARVVTIVESASQTSRVKELELELRNAYAAIGRKDCQLVYQDKLFEAAQKELGYDLKKNLEIKLSSQ